MLFVTGAVQIPCKKITRQLFLRTDLPDLAKYGGAGAYRRRLCSELYKDRFDRWFTRKLRISNRLWLHPKGYHEKNYHVFSEKEETGKVTQKKILLKSMRALEFQCPLKFRCQTWDYNTNFLTFPEFCVKTWKNAYAESWASHCYFHLIRLL